MCKQVYFPLFVCKTKHIWNYINKYCIHNSCYTFNLWLYTFLYHWHAMLRNRYNVHFFACWILPIANIRACWAHIIKWQKHQYYFWRWLIADSFPGWDCRLDQGIPCTCWFAFIPCLYLTTIKGICHRQRHAHHWQIHSLRGNFCWLPNRCGTNIIMTPHFAGFEALRA